MLKSFLNSIWRSNLARETYNRNGKIAWVAWDGIYNHHGSIIEWYEKEKILHCILRIQVIKFI